MRLAESKTQLFKVGNKMRLAESKTQLFKKNCVLGSGKISINTKFWIVLIGTVKYPLTPNFV